MEINRFPCSYDEISIIKLSTQVTRQGEIILADFLSLDAFIVYSSEELYIQLCKQIHLYFDYAFYS